MPTPLLINNLNIYGSNEYIFYNKPLINKKKSSNLNYDIKKNLNKIVKGSKDIKNKNINIYNKIILIITLLLIILLLFLILIILLIENYNENILISKIKKNIQIN